jgi:hypothetical protein
MWFGNAGRQTAPAFAAFSTSCTSAIAEKAGMRDIKWRFPHFIFPSPKPSPFGEGFFSLR